MLERSRRRFDIYVRPFPGPAEDGASPRRAASIHVWSMTTHELLFLNSDSRADHGRAARRRRRFLPRRDAADLVADQRAAVRPSRIPRTISIRTASESRLPRPRTRPAVQDHVVFVFNFADYLSTIAPGRK